jgi:carbonic anhydrase/acetyltransferase-like protein (isoleucine patch superfamily)
MTYSPHFVQFGRQVYVAPTAYIGGDVSLGDGCTVMHHVAIRGDVAPIRIGQSVNIQDGAVLHCNKGVPLEIGDEVTVGHRAVVHGKHVGSGTLIGIGAVVLDNADVGAGCIVAPGAVVTPGMQVPDGMVVMGVPARVVREVGDADQTYLDRVVSGYRVLNERHAAGEYPAEFPE